MFNVPSYNQSSSQYSYSHSTPPDVPSLNLNDECAICLEQFGFRVPDDKRTYREIAKTKCNHFFHQFCLEQHLQHGANTQCPLCRKDAIEYKIIDLDPSIKREVLKKQAQTQANANQSHHVNQTQDNKKEEIDLAEDMLNAGGAFLYGLGSLAFSAAKIGGSVLYNVAASGANAIASSLVETQQQFEERVQNLFRKWKKTTSDLEGAMSRNKEDVSLILSTLRSLPESSYYKTRASADRVEAAFDSFERNLIDNQNRLKQILSEEKKNLSIQ